MMHSAKGARQLELKQKRIIVDTLIGRHVLDAITTF